MFTYYITQNSLSSHGEILQLLVGSKFQGNHKDKKKDKKQTGHKDSHQGIFQTTKECQIKICF